MDGASRKEVYMMENAGFSQDDTKVTVVEVETSLSDKSENINGDIQATVQSEEGVPAVGTVTCNQNHCKTCTCDVQQQPKVELETWVGPKGWILLGTVLCLCTWIIVYFTVTHFYPA